MNPSQQKLEHISTALLIPYARNSRTHSPEQVKQVANSIKEFGFTNPVLIDGDNGIIAGHGRVMAAQLLELEQVPCIRLAYLSEAQKRAYIIADNQLALNSGWDEDMLRAELHDLQAIEFDMDLLGFDVETLDDLLGMYSDEVEMPLLKTGDKPAFQQMTFTLHDEQVIKILETIKQAKSQGPFIDSKNENGNGNALSRICETYLTQNGNS